MKKKIIYVIFTIILIFILIITNPIKVYSVNTTNTTNNTTHYKANGAFDRDVINSTVWAIDNITYYSQISKKSVNIGNLAEAIIINDNYGELGDKCDLEIRTATGDIGWIKYKDRNKLLINLPDVRSDIVYDITNAYSSKFKIGSDTNISRKGKTYSTGYVSIPNITGKKLYTYDNYDINQNDGKVWNSKLGRYEFVCPVRFNMAIKIGEAQNRALNAGYCLKIYDGYRPHDVSVNSYKQALNVSNTDQAKKLRNNIDIRMFLHDGISTHNRGVAVDLTMVYKNDKSKEINTASDIHDLSFNSAKGYYNTTESKKLLEIMKANSNNNSKNEFITATYEWWHFQLKDATSYGYAEGQIKYTNLMDFKAEVTKNNQTVIVQSNRPLKTIPSGWEFVKNTNNTKIQKKFSVTTNKQTIQLTDYNNRKLNVEIPEVSIFDVKEVICYIGTKNTKNNNFETSKTDNGKYKTIIIKTNMSIASKTDGWSYVKKSDYKEIQRDFKGKIEDKDKFVTITNSKGETKKINLEDYLLAKIKITAKAGNVTKTNTYNYNTISSKDNISQFTFTGNVNLKIETPNDKNLVYYINGVKTNTLTINKSTNNVRVVVKKQGVSITAIYFNIKINNNSNVPQMKLVSGT